MDKDEFNILIVDDEETIRETLKMILETEGYTVLDADSGEEAIKISQNNKIDLVLLDLKMKGMSGEETLKNIKDINSETMVIILTGHASLHSSMEAIKYGAYDYLKKPVSLNDIRNVVFKAYDRWKLSSLIKHYNSELKERYVKRNKEIISVITLSERLREIDSLDKGAKLVVDTIHDVVGFDKVVFYGTDSQGNPRVLNKIGFDKREAKEILGIYNNFKNNNIDKSSKKSYFSPIFFEKDIIGAFYVEKLETDLEREDQNLIKLLSTEVASFLLRFKYNIATNGEVEAPFPIKYDIPPGKSFIVYENKYEKSFEIFKDLVTHNVSGLAITRTPPDSLKKKYDLEKTPFLWLSKIEGQNTISPIYLNSIITLITDFFNKCKDSIVIVEGIEYLITQNNFDTVLKFIQALRDLVIIENSKLIIPLNKDAFSQKEIAQIEKELELLKLKN
ncbi:MAG: acetoacetate metabolism regulatory protein AtoC [Candidatus Methanofastidiosum methylothiophilum]|uniref:Acetoacetate metabolism regulatory protein AtoC n=1 Tax=Candidatus Methanofastidiosum methylothiophilum TaxID=1705564 RepID=A0A150IT81_9EURY|nr:MAG: acetoacetate metabolism regulatory protein AtoC [Candidatus Methanofastidiosum methylthiophilus]KYC48241.1 MAG: acetoacetate metabolism regulatory protein AtoC [Candidatus Methanofastidiosum methylthiophilus]KYC50898.1 MAG: acetoacetate metabolism regulatory protein AtoC [Candidatus Methanofastidiosum methylthiophilus]